MISSAILDAYDAVIAIHYDAAEGGLGPPNLPLSTCSTFIESRQVK